ncbi:NACHT domain-containing protein [Nodosilinea nodulosa]|uniref:NACHT domain-containing protein n=1 Tax=Nodosilinea nodulosa TaxID=416001 RepID=UPI00036E4695|nr:GUN4 domain-containing protein [Nodosilinea nodulosa]
MIQQAPGNQPDWWEPVQKFLDNKLVGWGLPGIFVAIAADHARESRWPEFRLFLGIAFGVWLLVKIGSKVLPYFDQFLDWVLASWVPRLWWSVTDRFKRRYYTSLIDHYRDYRTKGLKTQGDFVLDLDKVFVSLQVAPESLNQVSAGMLLPRSNVNRLDIWDFLAQAGKDRTDCRLAILGPPGSGKTTLLEYLTLTYAHNRQRQQHRQAPALIPVLIYLRDVRDKITSDQPPTLAELIHQQPLVKELQPRSSWFASKLKQGRCLVMLDGLDEVADEAQRQQVSRWVDRQMQTYPTPFIVTSRPFGYRSAPVERIRAMVEVQPFTFADVKQFVQSWYRQHEIKSRLGRNTPAVQAEANQKANDLIGRISHNAPLSAMAVNPLLLTMIATVHRFRGALPGSRLELYAEICDVLLGRRADAKGLTATLTVNQQKSVLQTLALGLMEQKTREFKLPLATQLIQAKLAAVAGQDADGAAFIKQAEDLSGLLVERERGQYEFAHKSLQEYLAAAEIKDTHRSHLLVANFEDAWWDETIRLYAAQSNATELIEAALTRESLSALALAYDCVEEGAEVDPDVRQALLNALEAGLTSTNPGQFNLAVDVKLTRRLRRFVRVDDALQIDNSYVTWAEYQRFLEHSEVKALLSTKVSLPVTYRKVPPGQASQPARGISREEAYHFCAWLGTYLPSATIGETTACYRLPTDQELRQHPIEADQHLAESGIRLVRFWVPTRYAQLATYLAAHQWRKADEETLQVMLQVASRESQGYLNVDDIRNFPCDDLLAIDDLWVQFSQSQFGFSVQKQIWIEVGGRLESDHRSWVSSVTERTPTLIRRILLRCGVRLKGDDLDTFILFAERVGWRQVSFSYDRLTFDTSAPKGHLPGPRWAVGLISRLGGLLCVGFFSRIAHCKL